MSTSKNLRENNVVLHIMSQFQNNRFINKNFEIFEKNLIRFLYSIINIFVLKYTETYFETRNVITELTYISVSTFEDARYSRRA